MATKIVIPGEVVYKKKTSPIKTAIAAPTASPTYQNIIKNRYGGNAQAYANDIKAKETAGTAFSNPEAAAAFKAANSQLFGTAPAQRSGAPVPEGYVGLRSFFEGMGYPVNWVPGENGAPGTITAGDFTFGPGSYKNVGGTAYIDPTTLAGMFLGQKPEKPTQENMDEYRGWAENIYRPLFDANRSALQTALNNLGLQADTSRRNVDLAYQQGADTLASNELSDKKGARRSAISRGIYASGTYDANRAEVDNFYLGEQNKLGQNRAANMANIESSLAQASAANLGQLQSLEANYMSDVNKSALEMFTTGQAQDAQRNSALGQYLMNVGQQNYQKAQNAKEFAYRQGRDKVADAQWTKQFDLSKEQWAKQFGLSKDQWDKQFTLSEKQYNSDQSYKKIRDAVGDAQWNKTFSLNLASTIGAPEAIVLSATDSAMSVMGSEYSMGGTGQVDKKTGKRQYDCSGYVSKILNDSGLAKGRFTSSTIKNILTKGTGEIEVYGWKPGWKDPKGKVHKYGHVWIKVGDKYFESNSSQGVVAHSKNPYSRWEYSGVPASLAAKTAGGTAEVPGTQAERQKLATSKYYNKGLEAYDKLRKQGSKYPLYNAVKNMLSNPAYIGPAISSGVNIKTAVDSLITTKTGKSVGAYLKDAQGSRLADLYYGMFPKKKAKAQKPLELATR